MTSLDDIKSIQEFWSIINKKIPLIKLNYYSTLNGRGCQAEREFIEVISEIKKAHELTKDKKYLILKDQAMIAYSNMISNIKLDSNYGR
jgi:hypothetical protein